MLRDSVIHDPFEYKNLRVSKNYVSSFASYADHNMEKAQEKLE